MQIQTNSTHISVVVATCNRTQLLTSRCLASITQQTRTPDKIIVVDDSRSEECRTANKQIVERLRLSTSMHGLSKKPTKPQITYLENQRTSGASGAWNTALYYLAEQYQHTFVAFLDDDDMWHPTYLEQCQNLSTIKKLDMVSADIRRIEACSTSSIIIKAPNELNSVEFLVGNPGIQCSNLYCRWSVLLAAGGFDEAMQCTTDRDIVIRIADLNTVRYGRIPEVLLDHYAEDDRERLSNRGSTKKLECLTVFWRKYYGRMTEFQKKAFKKRAKTLFDWECPNDFSSIPETALSCSTPLKPIKQHSKNAFSDSTMLIASPFNQSMKLHVGVITSAPDTLQPLLVGLASLQNKIGCPSLSVMVLDNGCIVEELNEVVENSRKLALQVVVINKDQQSSDALAGAFGTRYRALPGGQVGIAHARTMLQKYLGMIMTKDEGSLGWVLDDDMRVDDRFLTYFSSLPAFKHAGVDVLIGSYEGASPNPPLHGLRVQLVDLLHNLHWLQNLPPDATLPIRCPENAALRNRYPDYYYDLSRKHSAHLELPYWLEPAVNGETVEQALNRLSDNAICILNGAPLARHLQHEFPKEPLVTAKDSVNRGGTTFVLNPLALAHTPNFTLELDGKETRRSDMFWAIANRQLHNLSIKAVHFPVYHDRRFNALPVHDTEKVNGEMLGSALYAALDDFLEENPLHRLDFSPLESEKIGLSVEQHFMQRRRQLQLSIIRIVGLSQALRELSKRKSIADLCNTLDKWFKGDNKQFKMGGFKAPEHKAVQEFLINIRTTVNDYANAAMIGSTQDTQKPHSNPPSVPVDWCLLPNTIADFRMYDMNDEDVRVVSMGDIHKLGTNPLVRIHSSCLASEVFGALDCDCACQLTESMKLIATEGRGLIIHLQQEGRGHGLSKKIRAVSQMQTANMDTADAFDAMGLEQDTRTYKAAVRLLWGLKISSVRLISNNPRKKSYLAKHGIKVETTRTHPTERPENIDYLRSKKTKLGHELQLEEDRTSDESILFYHSDQPWGDLSNFSAHSIYYDKIVWPTVEHYYQANKFSDMSIVEKIRCCPTPTLAKIRAYEYQHSIRCGWLEERESVMLNGLRAKFNQHPDLRQHLLSSDERELIEHTKNDAYWGDGGDGSGANRLGNLLMQVRDELRVRR